MYKYIKKIGFSFFIILFFLGFILFTNKKKQSQEAEKKIIADGTKKFSTQKKIYFSIQFPTPIIEIGTKMRMQIGSKICIENWVEKL